MVCMRELPWYPLFGMHARGCLYCFAFTCADVGLKVVEGDGSVRPCLITTFPGLSSLAVVLFF